MVRDIAQEEMKITKRQFLVPPLGYMSDVAKILFYSISCFQKFLNSQHILIRGLNVHMGLLWSPMASFLLKRHRGQPSSSLAGEPWKQVFSQHCSCWGLSSQWGNSKVYLQHKFQWKKKKENSGKPITQNPSNNLSSNEIITLKHLTKKSQEVDLL